MSIERDPKDPRPSRVHRSSFAADARKVRNLGARIFAELLPQSTSRVAAALHARRSESSSGHQGRMPFDREATSHAIAAQGPASRAGKETPSMKVYRTESHYYFSSKQLLPAGSLVFFSDKLRRYVHPTAGTLLDPHPRLQPLSEAESQEFAEHWQDALVRY